MDWVRSGTAAGALHRPSVLDMASGHVYVPRLFFYRDVLDPRPLRASLARVLQAYPEMSGRLVRRAGEVMIECSDRGVLFETRRRPGRLPDYGPARPAQADLADYLAPRGFVRPGRDEPMMHVCLTRFDDGGSVLGIATCHTLVDGQAFYAFMKAWMAEQRGEDYPVPRLTRERIDALGDAEDGSGDDPDYRRLDRLDFARFVARLVWTRRAVRHAIVRFESERLAAMKDEAMAALAGTDRWVSTNDVLGAYLWRSYGRIKPPARSGVESLLLVQSLRHRLVPPLEPHFMGNALASVRIHRSAGALARSSTSELALDLRAAQDANTDPRLRRLLAFLVRQRAQGRLHRAVPDGIAGVFTHDTTVLNDWSRFPIYALDFGAGPPSWFEVPCSPLPSLFILAPTPHDRGARDVHIALPGRMARRFAQRLAAG